MANLSALLLVSSLLFLKTLDVSSRQFDSLELAVGEWDVNLSCLPEVYEHELFPLKRFEQPDPFTGIPSSSGIFRQSKNFPCLLTMYPNRTFVLAPEPCSSDILPLRGTFLTEGNPYWYVLFSPSCCLFTLSLQLTHFIIVPRIDILKLSRSLASQEGAQYLVST